MNRDRIRFSGAGPVEDLESEIERVTGWIVAFLEDQGETRRGSILGEAEGYSARTVERGLDHLINVGAVVRPRRGVYRRTVSANDPDQPTLAET